VPPATKALFVLPSLGFGGAERQVIDLVNGLPSGEFECHLFTFERTLDLASTLDRSRVRLYNLPRRYKFDLSPTKAIADIVDQECIDVVHCTLQIALLYGLIGSARARRKVILINAVHTTINRNLKYEILERVLYAQLMRFCDRIITVCHNQRIHLQSKYPFLGSTMCTIHNGIDTDKFNDLLTEDAKKEMKRSLGMGDDEFVIGMVGAFRPEKGHEYAFEAIRALRDAGSKVRLVLVGDGERREYLRSVSARLGLEDSIVWLGFQEDPRRYISLFDVLLMSSYTVETFSIAILEALSMGKIVIATDIGGASEMIEDGCNGFLVPPRRPELIADKVSRLLSNPSELATMSKRTRSVVLEKFDKSVMIRKTVDLFRMACTGRLSSRATWMGSPKS
jgi:glycosyltransferase involved in cell wall biosynthesis